MTDKGLEQLLKNQVKLGADLSVAVGPKGGGLEEGTTLAGDIFSYARSKGAFAGVSFEGVALEAVAPEPAPEPAFEPGNDPVSEPASEAVRSRLSGAAPSQPHGVARLDQGLDRHEHEPSP